MHLTQFKLRPLKGCFSECLSDTAHPRISNSIESEHNFGVIHLSLHGSKKADREATKAAVIKTVVSQKFPGVN
jgi:hypothetical protein